MRFASRSRFIAVFLLALALPALTLGSEDSSADPQILEVMVPMRDGVRLATTVYLPSGDGPWPVVLSRTPCSRERSGARSGERFIEHGFAFAIQDQRGRFGSEGEYTPHENEIEDGYDSVEWAGVQSWSTGKVGISGASALGIAANLAACSAPPHLKAAWVVVAPRSLFYEGRFIGGIFNKNTRNFTLFLDANKPINSSYQMLI